METQAFVDHPLWSSIKATLELLDECDSITPDAYRHQAERIRAVGSHLLSYAPRNVPNAYAAMISPEMLQQLANSWSNVQGHVTNHKNQPASGYLAQASQHLDSTLSQIGTWPLQGLRGGAAAQAAGTFQEYTKQLEALIDSLREEVAALTDQHKSDAQALDEMKRKLLALDTKITQEEARLDTALTTHVEAFNSSQTKRTEDFDKWLVNLRKSNDEAAEEQHKYIQGLSDDADQIITDLEGIKQKAETVAGAAASASIARDYSQRAADEQKYGFWAYGVGFLVTVLAITFLIITLWSIRPSESVSWQFVSLRLGVTFGLFGVAAVAFTLGNRFLTSSGINKRIDLELRAIGPFLADVEEDDEGTARQVKLAFIERTFGRTWDTNNAAPAEVESTNTLVRVVEGLTTLLSKNG